MKKLEQKEGKEEGKEEKKTSEDEEEDLESELLSTEMTAQHKEEEDAIERGIALQQEGLKMVEHTLQEKEELLRTVQEEHNKIQNVSGTMRLEYVGFDEGAVP